MEIISSFQDTSLLMKMGRGNHLLPSLNNNDKYVVPVDVTIDSPGLHCNIHSDGLRITDPLAKINP
jgi:hypothetical protein